MVEYKEIKKRIFFEGVELASFCASYPCFEENESITKFYEGLAQNTFEWFCGEFCERLRAEYEANTDSKKRFATDARRYLADFRVTQEDDEFVTVKIEVVLKKGKREEIASFCDEQKWDRQNGLLVRPRKKKEKIPEQK